MFSKTCYLDSSNPKKIGMTSYCAKNKTFLMFVQSSEKVCRTTINKSVLENMLLGHPKT